MNHTDPLNAASDKLRQMFFDIKSRLKDQGFDVSVLSRPDVAEKLDAWNGGKLAMLFSRIDAVYAKSMADIARYTYLFFYGGCFHDGKYSLTLDGYHALGDICRNEKVNFFFLICYSRFTV